MCSLIGWQNASSAVFGVNYDFFFNHGLLVVSPRGTKKTAMGNKDVSWEAVYGTATLNQFGRELPTAGMNETGLAGHVLRQINISDDIPAEEGVNELQWLQIALDSCKTVEEVKQVARQYPVKCEMFPLHYAFADAEGRGLFVETIRGELIFHEPDVDKPFVLTNHDYRTSAAVWRCGKKLQPYGEERSLYHFSELAKHAKQLALNNEVNRNEAINHIFAELKRVAVKLPWWQVCMFWKAKIPLSLTAWSTVFDCASKKIFFKTARSGRRRCLDLTDLLFDQEHQVRCIDINKPAKGEVSGLLESYVREHNEKLINLSYGEPVLTPEERQALIDYPITYEFNL